MPIQQKEVKEITTLKADKFAMIPKPFSMCSLPLRQPRDNNGKLSGSSTHTNGKIKLEIVTSPEVGLPFGRDLWILLWLKSESKKHGSRRIPFHSAAEVLKWMGFCPGGKNRKWLRDGIKRIMYATYFYGLKDVKCSDIAMRFNFISKVHIRWATDKKKYDETLGDFIEVSEAFFNSPPIPFNREILHRFDQNVGAMNFYTWVAPRWFSMGRKGAPELYVSLRDLREQFGTSLNVPQKKFKQQLKKWIKDVDKILLPELGGPSGVEIREDLLFVPWRCLEPPKSKLKKQLEKLSPKPE